MNDKDWRISAESHCVDVAPTSSQADSRLYLSPLLVIEGAYQYISYPYSLQYIHTCIMLVLISLFINGSFCREMISPLSSHQTKRMFSWSSLFNNATETTRTNKLNINQFLRVSRIRVHKCFYYVHSISCCGMYIYIYIMFHIGRTCFMPLISHDQSVVWT